MERKKSVSRRNFMKLTAAGGAGIIFSPMVANPVNAENQDKNEKPKTNIDEALKYPRTKDSMPGKCPGKVVEVNSELVIKDGKTDYSYCYKMLEQGMTELSGKSSLKKAWRKFVDKHETIGLKVNPIGGKLLSTNIELVKAVVKQLEESGIKRENIVIFDRRKFQLTEAGFTEENFPGIRIEGAEHKDEAGSFYDEDGKLYGEKMIDKDWYYYADCEMEYDAYTMPYMINQGKYSYFHKLVTQGLDKIINIPIMKNAGASITVCMKNLGYGVISNTSRLHAKLWGDTSAQVCAFPPVRDKVVLNIADGIKGCFDGGPGANPQFITEYKRILLGSDPVAVDRIAYDIIIGKRIEMGRQKEHSPRGVEYMKMANSYQLGENNIDKIDHKKIKV